MKAVILAGGEGRRLRPLTEEIPKPLLPVDNEPVIVRILRHLRAHGINEAVVTVGYLADKLINALGKECEGVSLTFFRENEPLGTAGGILRLRDSLSGDDFLVVSGDVLNECDLTRAVVRHRESGAAATLVLVRQSDPSEYGVVLTDGEGRVTGFSEKPSLSSTYSDTVNGGIYVFSPEIFDFIPEGKADISRDVLPRLMSSGKTVTGVIDDGYWCDIGDIHSYRLANLRFTDGGNTMGKDCFIPNGTARGSVFHDRVRVGLGASIDNSVICSDVTVGRGCVIGEGSVIGRGTVIGEDSVLADGTVLGAESVVPSGSTVRGGSFIDRTVLSTMLDGDGLTVKAELVTPSLMMRLGQALAMAVGGGRVGIMNDGGRESLRATSALLRGVGMSGGESMVLGEGFEAAASYGAVCMSLDLSVLVSERPEGIVLRFYDSDGLYPKRAFERALLSAVGQLRESRGEGKRLSSCELVNDYYYPMLIKNRCPLEGYKVCIKRQNRPSELLKRVLVRLGADVGNEGLKLSVSDDGFSLSAEQEGVTADDWHIKALIVRYLVRDGASLPMTSPTVLRDLCRGRISTYSHCPDGDGENEARRLSLKHPELIHAIAAAAELTAMLSATGKSLKELLSRLPSFAYTTCTVKTGDKRRLSILTLLGSPDGDGMISEYAYGTVRIVPVREGYRLYSEAASGEYANELISMSEKEIRRLLNNE